jgi:hypothetical protein
MNSLEARFILQSCRVGEFDTSDPKMAGALRAVESDPELASWFAASQEFDRLTVAKLRAVPVPEDLARRIRAGKVEAAPSPPRRSRRQWLAVAALVCLLAALAARFVPFSGPGDLAAFRNDMADFMDQRWDRTFDVADPQFATIRQWLESRSDAIRIDVPVALAASRTLGCKTFKWRGNTATLICFMPKDAGAVVHILIVDRAAVTNPPGAEPQLARLPNWNSAVWSRGDKVYLALTTAQAERLNGCL